MYGSGHPLALRLGAGKCEVSFGSIYWLVACGSSRPFCLNASNCWPLVREYHIGTATQPPGKQASSFYPPAVLRHARENIRRFEWAAEARDELVAAAEPWLKMSDDELWGLMFGPTITRSWMVWSNGHCPACKQERADVQLGDRRARPPVEGALPALQGALPQERLPQASTAPASTSTASSTRSAPTARCCSTPSTPTRTTRCTRSAWMTARATSRASNRWRFIGAYLIYGQWKQAIVAASRSLAAAYVVTGDPRYAHKAGVLLDRVADLYPTFDFAEAGRDLREAPARAGYVSTWHDACEETRELALAYDQVFDGARATTGAGAIPRRQGAGSTSWTTPSAPSPTSSATSRTASCATRSRTGRRSTPTTRRPT